MIIGSVAIVVNVKCAQSVMSQRKDKVMRLILLTLGQSNVTKVETSGNVFTVQRVYVLYKLLLA